MSNLSLARIMFGSSEEVRRIAGSGMTANVSALAPVCPRAARGCAGRRLPTRYFLVSSVAFGLVCPPNPETLHSSPTRASPGTPAISE